MSDGNRPTVNEHYVPQVYLRGFSVNNDQKTVFRYDLKKLGSEAKQVPIKSIAFEKHLYELYDDNNEFILRNHIEKSFHIVEDSFLQQKEKLLSKLYDSRYKTGIPLFDEEEKKYWSTYILLQMLRTPEIISVAKDFMTEYYKEPDSIQTLHSFALMQEFPFFGDNSGGVFGGLINQIYNAEFFLGYALDSYLFTSDNPISATKSENNSVGQEEIIFPLSSDCILLVLGRGLPESNNKNKIFSLDEESITYIKENMVLCAKDSLFSNRQFTESELRLIREVQTSDLKKERRIAVEDRL